MIDCPVNQWNINNHKYMCFVILCIVCLYYLRSFKSVYQNLPKSKLFEIFPHVQYLEIHSWYHPFSLDSLISLIAGTNINRVVIREGYWLKELMKSNVFVKENWR